MYVPKPKRTIVVEETFILLKPDSSLHHSAIIDIFVQNGFVVSAKKVGPSNPAAVDTISFFMPLSTGEAAAALLAGAAAASSSAADAGGFNLNGTVGSLDSSSGGSLASTLKLLGQSSKPSSGGSTVGGAPAPPPRRAVPRLRMAESEGPPLVESGLPSIQPTREDHRLHLMSGTCLALAVSAPNAIEQAKLLCGPEDPQTARAEPATSRTIRALYGVDLLKNAVFCAPNDDAAFTLISTVFGYEPTKRTEVQNESGGNAAQGNEDAWLYGDAGLLDGGGALGGPALSTTVDAAALVMKSGWGHFDMLPTTAAAAVGSSDLATTALTAAALGASGPSATLDGSGAAISSAVDKLQALREVRGRIAAERLSLKREAELLRKREVDLLLREQALRVASQTAYEGDGGSGGVSSSRHASTSLK
jgi:nucleoside diphosphate kinase